jgi:dienelactone hydrolase
MEYPGYSVYKGSSKMDRVRDDAFTVFDFLVTTVGFKPENIIVMGRSIGTGTVQIDCYSRLSKLLNERHLLH